MKPVTFKIGDVKIGFWRDPKGGGKIFKDGALVCMCGSARDLEEVLRTVVGNIACHLVDYSGLQEGRTEAEERLLRELAEVRIERNKTVNALVDALRELMTGHSIKGQEQAEKLLKTIGV